MTKLYTQLAAWQHCRNGADLHGKTIGFVPTMGCLHAGHLSLLKRSLRDNDVTVMSIFVNPTQFNQRQDYQKYPNTFKEDYELAQQAQVDFVLKLDYTTLYPDNYRYRLRENVMSQYAEGKARAGHFDGMLTVVMKWLHIVKPNRAYFGKKDHQQWQLVKGMVTAFHMPVDIVACETIRESDGLAMSSRNRRLNTKQRALAARFYELLCSDYSCDSIKSQLKQEGFVVDYIEEVEGWRLGAVYLGSVRLIDNVELK